MKIVPLALVLAWIVSPAVALRGTRNARRTQDVVADPAAPAADVVEEVTTPPDAAIEEIKGPMFYGIEMVEGAQQFPVTGEDGKLYVDASTTEPWVMDEKGMWFQTDRRRSSKGKSSSKRVNVAADSRCQAFCQRYLSTCESANHFFNPPEPRGGGTNGNIEVPHDDYYYDDYYYDDDHRRLKDDEDDHRRRLLEEADEQMNRRLEILDSYEPSQFFEKMDIDDQLKERLTDLVEQGIEDAKEAHRGRRRLIAGNSFDIPRLEGSIFEAREDCESTCMGYPRPINPSDYIGVPQQPGGPIQMGDTLWCREQQLRLAERHKNNYGAQVFCPRASPGGAGFCSNVVFDASQSLREDFDTPLPNPSRGNGTAYEFLRAGFDTGRHLGYCRSYYDDMVADCTNSGIDDRSLPLALAMISPRAQVIILSNNVGKPAAGNPGGDPVGEGITILPNRTFANLIQPTNIRAVIIDDGNIHTVEQLAFGALTNVEMISLNNQRITTLFDQNLQSNLALRDFSIANTDPRKPGMLSSLPPLLFRRNPFIQRVVISGHKALTTIPADFFVFTLNGNVFPIKFLVYLNMANNGLVNSGVSANDFRDFGVLQTFDLSNNNFQTLQKEWFDSLTDLDGLPWPFFVFRNFYFHGNRDCTLIEDFAFDSARFLETATLHDLNSIITIPVGLFTFQSYPFFNSLISYTISEANPGR